MKKLSLFLILMAPLLMTGPLHAVTYTFPESRPVSLKDDAVMKVGSKLYLFHSGTEGVTKTMKVGDILAVYREYPDGFSPETSESGKVKVLSSLGENYFEAEVVEGEIRTGYLARKGTVACFVTSFKKNGH